MVRKIESRVRKVTGSNRRRRVVPVIGSVCLFAIVLGVLAMLLTPKSVESVAQTEAQPAHATPPSRVLSPKTETPKRAALQPVVAVGETKKREASVVEAVAETPEVDSLPSPQERISSHLAAGEFGPALDLVLSVEDGDQQTVFFQMIADAQMDAGEFDSAATAIRKMPVSEKRTEANSRRVEKKSLAGGSGADYQTLIDLITENTKGPWESIDGEGAPDPTEYDNGVRVDPFGLLYQLTKAEQTGRLKTLGLRARKADLNDDMAATSGLRLVSLTRLEREAAKLIADGKPVLETMKHLAGLSQIRHIFIYPEQGEIVIGGPAEGWRIEENGAVVGTESGRPTLQLDDFVTVLRTFGPEGDAVFRCSINPRREGMARTRQFVAASNARGPMAPSAVKNWTRQLEEQLGVQDVVINGVPLESRVARVIVEADYRMKLIGIGKLANAAGIPSYFDLLPRELQKNSPTTNALRWWMTMKYDSVLHSPNRDVYEIQGSSVLCRSENEMIADDGKRIHTGKAEATNRLFAENFSKSFARLAEQDPIFGDLQNIFDLALVAALIRHDRLDDRVNWDHGVFAADGAYQTAEFQAPRTLMSVVNHRVYTGGNIVVQVAGGVRGDLMSVVNDDKVYREADRLANLSERGKAPVLPAGRWWWDAAKYTHLNE